MTNDDNDRDQPYQYRRGGDASHTPGRLQLAFALAAFVGALAFAAYTAAEYVL